PRAHGETGADGRTHGEIRAHGGARAHGEIGAHGETDAHGETAGPTATAALDRLYAAVNAPRSLRALGMPGERLSEAAKLIGEAAPPSNPRPVTEANALELLRAAF